MNRAFYILLMNLLIVSMLPTSAHAENDGNNRRAVETQVISPALDGRKSYEGLAVLPNGYVYNNFVYLFVHAHFLGAWRPSGLSLCTINGQSWDETKVLWKLPLSNLFQKATFLGRVAPCSDTVGSSSIGPGVGIGGTGAVGGNGKFYLTTNRTACANWFIGCMDNEYLGAETNPDNIQYAWQLSPILASSPVANRTLNWLGFVVLKSFVADPMPPSAYFPRITTPVGPALLWGYVGWGFTDELPTHLARVQIAETASTLRPSWQTTKVYVYASDGTWKSVAAGGKIDFIPYDAAADFGGKPISSLYYDTVSRAYLGVGEHPGSNGADGTPGCDEKTSLWYTNPGPPPPDNPNPYYHSIVAENYSSLILTPLGGANPTIFYYDTYTRNSQHIGGWALDVGNPRARYFFRGSTERTCLNYPASWWHPWVGAEITVETF